MRKGKEWEEKRAGRGEAPAGEGEAKPVERPLDVASDGEPEAQGAGEPGFEEALARLEEIVRTLESGDSSLQKSLLLFEEGIRMARICSRRLDEAETRIRVLLEGEDGSLYEEAWDDDGDGPSFEGSR